MKAALDCFLISIDIAIFFQQTGTTYNEFFAYNHHTAPSRFTGFVFL